MLTRTLVLTLCVAGYPAFGHAAPQEQPSAAPASASARASTGAVETAARAGIKRFIQVDDRLYRGSQPDAAGFRYLRDQGIRTIVSLRNTEDERKSVERERQVVESLGMSFVNIPVTMKMFGPTGDISHENVTRFLGIVDDPANGKVFVHCRRGADRTGTFVGLYRILRQGWDVDRAYAEARAIGMRWWYSSVKDQLKSLAMSFAAAPVTASTKP